MEHVGYNFGNVKVNNRSALLNLLNEQGAMSRKDLAEALGLTPAAVTSICSELLAAGILTEEGTMREERRVGRKKVMVGINYIYRYALAISIELVSTTITVSDLKGDYHMSKQIPTLVDVSSESFLEQVAQVGLQLLQSQNIPEKMILGVGVSVPGPVDRETGVSCQAYGLWKKPVPIRACLEKYFTCPVLVDNNIHAIAKAEMIYGCGRRHDNLLFLKWGPGVGGALVIRDQLYESNCFKECEIGHVKIEENGMRCHCGRTGCLETRVSVPAILDEVRKNCTPETMPLVYKKIQGEQERITGNDMSAWYVPEDPGLQRIIDEKIRLLTRVLGNVITIFAPDHVLLLGPMFDLPGVAERFQMYCKQYDGRYDEKYLYPSKLRVRQGYIGPLAMVTGELFLTTREILE